MEAIAPIFFHSLICCGGASLISSLLIEGSYPFSYTPLFRAPHAGGSGVDVDGLHVSLRQGTVGKAHYLLKKGLLFYSHYCHNVFKASILSLHVMGVTCGVLALLAWRLLDVCSDPTQVLHGLIYVAGADPRRSSER